MIKRLRLFLKLFWIMVSPRNSPFTSTLPATPFSFNPHPTTTIDCSGWNCSLGPLPPFFPLLFCRCFPSPPSPPFPHVLPCTHKQGSGLPPSPREGRHGHVSSPNLRDSKNWTDHEAGVRQSQVRGMKNVFPLNLQSLGKKKWNQKTLNQTRETLFALRVWELNPRTEESNKHSRRSGEQIWEGIFVRFPYCSPSVFSVITKRDRYGSADMMLTFNTPPIPFTNSWSALHALYLKRSCATEKLHLPIFHSDKTWGPSCLPRFKLLGIAEVA